MVCPYIKAERTETFVEKCEAPNIYLSHQAMLAQEDLDLSFDLCLATSAAQIVIDAVEAGARAIHSEKPMADTWGNAWRRPVWRLKIWSN